MSAERNIRGTKSNHERKVYNKLISSNDTIEPTVKQKKMLPKATDSRSEDTHVENPNSRRPRPMMYDIKDYLEEHWVEIFMTIVGLGFGYMLKDLNDKYHSIDKDVAVLKNKIENIDESIKEFKGWLFDKPKKGRQTH